MIIVQAEADVLDLCETACDVAADFLGLSDDQATHSFEIVVVQGADNRRNFFFLSCLRCKRFSKESEWKDKRCL